LLALNRANIGAINSSCIGKKFTVNMTGSAEILDNQPSEKFLCGVVEGKNSRWRFHDLAPAQIQISCSDVCREKSSFRYESQIVDLFQSSDR